jgi:hypothetical protein
MNKPSLDFRTKKRSEVRQTSVEAFVEEVARPLCERHGDLAARAQRRLGLPSLSLRVGDASCTVDQGSVAGGTTAGALLVDVEPDAFSDLVAGLRSAYSLVFVGGAELPGGGHVEFLTWDQAFKALFDGVPLYEPGTLQFRSRDGAELDLHRSFTPADTDDDIAHFVAEAGYGHLRGWVDPGLLPRIAEEVSLAARTSKRDDPDRWWATLEDGSERCVRVMRAPEVSPTLAGLFETDAFARLGKLFPDGHRLTQGAAQSSEALIKPVGVVSGLAEFPWHRDCSMGGHAYDCAGYAVGLPLTATGTDAGYLRVVAGSHRVSMPPPKQVAGYDADLPRIRLETEPGDLTVHVGCTLHGTRPPRSAERIVAYTTFSLPDDRPPEAVNRTDPHLDRVAAATS